MSESDIWELLMKCVSCASHGTEVEILVKSVGSSECLQYGFSAILQLEYYLSCICKSIYIMAVIVNLWLVHQVVF